MARGGRRGNGSGRGKPRNTFSGGGGGSGNGFAQSGGKQTTFNPGGGNTWNAPAGGNRGASSSIKARGVLGSGTPYNVRSPGGDSTLVKGLHEGVGSAAPLHARGKGIPNPRKVVVKPRGAARQAGGSTQ